jgi:lysyl-tRNA synthetase class 2
MSTEEMSMQELESQYNEQEGLRREKLTELQNAGKDPFDVYKVNRTHTSEEVKANYDTLEGKEVTVAGRLMSKRVHGKAGFSDLQDRYGRIQLYIKIDAVGEEKLKEYKSFDIGDLLSVSGTTFVTQTGEITLHIVDFKLIAKSLKPLPENLYHLKIV